MKKSVIAVIILMIAALGCRKQDNEQTPLNFKKSDSLTLDQVKNWYNSQPVNDNVAHNTAKKVFNFHAMIFNWNKAANIHDNKHNWWTVALDGQPSFKGAKQGYRKLSFVKDSAGAVEAHILEIIPDAAYIHIHHGADTKTFTGLVFVYDAQYQLQNGMIYHNGKQVGRIKAKPSIVNNLPAHTLSTADSKARVNEVAISATCDWVDDNYINGEGEITVYSYQECQYQIYNDGFGGDGNDISGDPLGAGGGGGGGESTGPAASVILPDQPKAAIDPKSYINCFGTLPDAGAAETITVYVQEPQPGLPFNYGSNSVGHTAISLSKSNNGQMITQTFGFYPVDSKLAATGTSAKLVDNTNLIYTVSITYNVLPFEFNAIINFIANPPTSYNLYTYNCTNFVYDACSAGNITLPNPTGNMGMFQTGMTPGALGSSISNVASVLNANTNGGTVGQSHGPCN